MAKAIHYNPDMVCPYCGNDDFYIKQSYKGTCEYRMRFDMDNADLENGDIFDTACFKTISKFAYCNNCRKQLFPICELPVEV